MSAVAVPVPVIECDAVVKTYRGGVDALRGVTLRIDRGEFVAIVGPSGSGKSTLLQLMGALDVATSGDVRIAGQSVASLSDANLSRVRGELIGFVFQQFHLSNLVDARENVAEGLLYAGVPAKARRARAEEALCRLGLEHRLRHRPQALSGGERQRVAIARAVVGDPAVILADEPTGNLDTANGESVVHVLRELAREGTTVVVVTHDRDLAASMDRQIVIRDGLIESVGTDQG